MANFKATMNIQVDAGIMELAAQFLDRMGLDVTTAVDMFFRKVVEEQRLPFQPSITPTLDEQLIAALLSKNPKIVELEADENGNILIDKDLHPDIYDWAVNG